MNRLTDTSEVPIIRRQTGYMERETYDLTPDSAGHSFDCEVAKTAVRAVASPHTGSEPVDIEDIDKPQEYSAVDEESDDERARSPSKSPEIHYEISPDVIIDDRDDDFEEYETDYALDERLADIACERLEHDYETCLAAAEGRPPVRDEVSVIEPSKEFLEEYRKETTPTADESALESISIATKPTKDTEEEPEQETNYSAVQEAMKSISISLTPSWAQNADDEVFMEAIKSVYF